MSDMEVVYVLTNPAMPGLVKIGRTSESDANDRIAQLYTTGVPVPFNLEYACKVANSREVEQALHFAFGPQRVNPKREFFRIDPEQAMVILRLLNTEDATSEVQAQPAAIDEQDLAAAEQMRKRRPNMNFVEMGIPVGSTLRSTDTDAAVIVASPKSVRLGEEEMSLTAATKKVLGISYAVGPSPRWTFEGKTLLDIYEDTYPYEE